MERPSNRNNSNIPSVAIDQLSISDDSRMVVPTANVANDSAEPEAAAAAAVTKTEVVLNPLMEQNDDSTNVPLAEEERLYACHESPSIDNGEKEAEITYGEADMAAITACEKDSDHETNPGTSTKETATLATSSLLESLINTHSIGDDDNSNILFPPLHSNDIISDGPSNQEVEEEDKITPSVSPKTIAGSNTNTNTTLSMSAPPDFFYRNHEKTLTSLQQQEQQKRKQQNMKFIDPLGYNASLHPLPVPFSNCSTILEQETTVTTATTNSSAINNQATTTTTAKSPLRNQSFPPFVPSFTYVSVSDPRYVSDSYYGGGSAVTTGVGFFSSLATGTSYWVYTVTSTLRSGSSTAASASANQCSSTNAKQLTIHVQRRFRHFDALQDRLREVCPGSILPARPGKHSPNHNVLEDTLKRQSPAFASQRAKELHQYLNALIQHPIAGNSEPLRFFLTFMDDLGTAWPEVSTSAFTRLTAGVRSSTSSTATTSNSAFNTSNVLLPDALEWPATSFSYDTATTPASTQPPEDTNMEIVRMCQLEQVRMQCVSQAIPKVNRMISLIGELYDKQSLLAAELSKVDNSNPSLDVMAGSLARISVVTRRLAIEVSASMDSFVRELRNIRMERAAIDDRREAFRNWWNLRLKAEQKTQKVHLYQQNGVLVQKSRFEAEAAYSESIALEASKHAEEIGTVLQSEVCRIKNIRHREWTKGIKIMAANMKEAHEEQKCIWDEARNLLLKSTFPSY